MKLALHKSQIHRYSAMHWWACSSLMSIPCLQRRVGKIASGLFCFGLYCVTIPWQHTCKGSL